MQELINAINQCIPKDTSKPIVVYSAIWPLIRAFKHKPEEISKSIIRCLQAWTDKTTVLMPTFTNGFENSFCNLDEEPSLTGALSESFRQEPGSFRTKSAFFSFAAKGLQAEFLSQLEPTEAWGAHSLYEWFYKNDAHIITIGLHPTHCSFSHYAEYLRKAQIPYRFDKTFDGDILLRKQRQRLSETLLARCYEPQAVENDFTVMLDNYLTVGKMKLIQTNGIYVSEISARAKIDILTQALDNDPFALVKEKEKMRALYENK